MANTIKPEELLLHEYDQQYQQYRHLDTLRERYVAFYVAIFGAILVYLTQIGLDISKNIFYIEPQILLFLFFIGFSVIHIAVSIRITQVLTSLALIEIRKALIRMLSLVETPNREAKHIVCQSYLMANYSPPKLDNLIQIGWNWRESAIELIVLLIFVNSLIFVYFIKIITNLSNIWLFFVLLFTIFIQIWFFNYRFKSDLNTERLEKRKKEMKEVLKDVCEFPTQ